MSLSQALNQFAQNLGRYRTAGVASSATAVIGMINPAPNVDTAVRQAANRVTLLTEFPSLGPCFFAIL